MPVIKLKTIRECSSEDQIHKAENLLHLDGKKWKTKFVGEKSAYVIIELDEISSITGIDIGNEHSAFVEVLVSNGGCAPIDFKDILITCSFMTPIESKNSTNTNRVRCFNKEALVQEALNEKWRQVKVICTQPFNKHVQYGLSFIKLHTVEKSCKEKSLVPEKFLISKPSVEPKSNNPVKQNPKIMGKFSLREESPDSETESTASLFNRWKNTRNIINTDSVDVTTAAAIRRASNSSNEKLQAEIAPKQIMPKQNQTSKILNISLEDQRAILDRNRDSLIYDDEVIDVEDERALKLSKQIEIDRDRLKQSTDKTQQKTSDGTNKDDTQSKFDSTIKKPHKGINSEKLSKVLKTENSCKKRMSSPSPSSSKNAKKPKTVEYRPFDKLLQGVVLTISGIQNPDRAQLRSKALEMGAKYKADWQRDCTHLICAFINTPKYREVKGKGKIVTRSWIEKCYDVKKYLPWRRYALDRDEVAKAESDEEILDETLRPTEYQNKTSDKKENAVSHDFTLSLYDNSNDSNRNEGSDTDDEIQRIQMKNSIKTSNDLKCLSNKEQITEDIYENTTDEEEFLNKKSEQRSAEFNSFHNAKFYICNDLSIIDKNKLEEIIIKFKGCLTENFTEARYAISNQPFDKSSSFFGETVRPLWLFECKNVEKRVDTKCYLI